MPVLQALIDETHRLGHKAGCHVYGGEGQKNAILAGCDTIEHAFGLDQEQANMIVSKGLSYDPTLVRYTEPYMDDNDNKNTGGKYRMIPIFNKAVTMAGKTKGISIMVGSGVDGSTFPHGTQALEFEALVKQAGLDPGTRDPIRHHRQRRGFRLGQGPRLGGEGQIRRPGRGLRRSSRRHRRTAARQIRDEGRKNHPQRVDAVRRADTVSGARRGRAYPGHRRGCRTRAYGWVELLRNPSLAVAARKTTDGFRRAQPIARTPSVDLGICELPHG